MKNPFLFLSGLLILTVLALSGCSHNESTSTKVGNMDIPNILHQDTLTGTPAEQMMIRSTFNKSIEELRANQDDPKPLLALASAYILEGRVSGNGAYYANAAIKVLNKALEGETTTQDQKFEALSLKSTVLLNMHQFKDAFDAAEKGLAISQFNAGIWGALVDANVELGNYPAAVKAADKMTSIRPDLRSYSRIAYLRQIYGDYPGAIEAMKMAVEAGVPGLESTEWARVQLGDLYLNSGKPDSGRLQYRYSLVYRPNYPEAEIGLARADAAAKQYDSAIVHARAAIKTMSEAKFVAYLGDLYDWKGDAKKAAEVRADVLRLLKEVAADEPKDALVIHNNAREMSMAYLDTKDYENALKYAKIDYDMRPDNIDANELMGWVYYLKGDAKSAAPYAEKSLSTGSKKPATLYKAGLILAAAGDKTRGESLQNTATATVPNTDPKTISGSN